MYTNSIQIANLNTKYNAKMASVAINILSKYKWSEKATKLLEKQAKQGYFIATLDETREAFNLPWHFKGNDKVILRANIGKTKKSITFV
jgi:hypothetical protein